MKSEKDKYCMISFIVESKNYTNESIYKKKKGIENKLWFPKGKEGVN